MKRRTVLPLAALALLAAAPEPSPRPAVLHLQVVPGHAAAEPWEGLQFVQADRNGRAFLIRVNTLQVYPLSLRNGLGSPAQLAAAPSVSDDEILRDAAMGGSGDDWILFSGFNGVREFVGGEEKKIPAPGWQVSAVVWPTRGPLVAVLPIELANAEMTVKNRDAAPLLLRQDDMSWETAVSEPSTLDGTAKGALQNLRWRTESRLAPGAKGSVWIATQTAYRVRQFAPDMKLLDEIVVGDGKTKFVDRPEKELAEIERDLVAKGVKFDRSKISTQRAQRIVAGLTGAPDGRLYLIVEAEQGEAGASGLVLDRFDPDREVLERIGLDGIQGGRFSLAPAKDALFIVSADGSGGRWYVDWNELDDAKWVPVEHAQHNGVAIPRTPARAAVVR